MEQTPQESGRREERRPIEHVQRFQFGPWLFNVERAKDIIADNPRDVHSLPVQPWARFYGLDLPGGRSFSLFRPASEFDAEYAVTTDLTEPVIVATLRSREGGRFPLLIDGTHRLYRAQVQGVAELPAHVLTIDESLEIREDAAYR
jgi:hypothetical protein